MRSFLSFVSWIQYQYLTNNKELMFRIEKEIKKWKKQLNRFQAFEDGYIAELESHLRDQVEDYINAGMEGYAAFEQAVKDLGIMESIGEDYHKTDSRRFFKRPPWKPNPWVPSLISNYFKIAVRGIQKQRLFALINILGLAVGIAASLLICRYVIYERSYDQFHKDPNLIYRIRNDRYYSAKHDKSAGCTAKLGPALKETIPGVLAYTRIRTNSCTINYKDKHFRERRVLWTDASFLSIFSFPLISGNVDTALKEPKKAVITENTAKKYFGEENPIGKKLNISGIDYWVTGVAENIPQNTVIKWDVLLSFNTLITTNENFCWNCNNTITYIKVSPDSNRDHLQSLMPGIVKKLHPDYDIKREYILQPLNDIHLYSNLRFELEKNGDAKTVNIMLIISIAILLIAWLNYINLASARAVNRAKEVGIRKMTGASRGQLMKQFLLESFLINLLASVPAIVLYIIIVPSFDDFAGLPGSFSLLKYPFVWMLMGIIIFVGSFLAGFYPAFVMSSFNPGVMLKGFKGEKNKGGLFRKILTVFQFAVSIFLIAGSITMYKQVSFMKNRDLGIDIQQTLAISFPGNFAEGFNHYGVRDAFINQLKQSPHIRDVTFSSIIPGEQNSNVTGGVKKEGGNKLSDEHQIYMAWTALNFQKVMGLKLVSGRNFLESDKVPLNHKTNNNKGIILNETAAKVLGFYNPEEALYKGIGNEEGKFGNVIGVIKDYHGRSLDRKVLPIIFYYSGWGTYYLVKLNTTNTLQLRETIVSIKKSFHEKFPGNSFDYYFLDDFFNRQYLSDTKFYSVFGIFSALAIFIGCLGLLGLTSFSLSQQTKEIGVRKVLGASLGNIFYFLSGNLLRLVLVSSVIAIPAAYLVMSVWIAEYPIRIEIGAWFFVIPVISVLIISYLVISGQVYKAVRIPAIKSLKEE